MLVDPGFAAELGGIPQAAQTLAFVNRVMAGLLYVDIQAVGSTLTCQVKTGDGLNHLAVTNVMVRLAADVTVVVPPALPAPPGVSVGTGILKSGTGTNILWVQSTAAGVFSLTITGTGSILVELTPNQGVAMSAGIG